MWPHAMPRSRSTSPRRGEGEEGGARGPVISFFAGFGERVRDFATAPLSTVFASDRSRATSAEREEASREAAGVAWWRVTQFAADDESLASAPADFGGSEQPAIGVQAGYGDAATPALRDYSAPTEREGGPQQASTWRFFRAEESASRVVYSRPRRKQVPPAESGRESGPKEGSTSASGLGRLASPSRKEKAAVGSPAARAPVPAEAPATPESDAASTSEKQRRRHLHLRTRHHQSLAVGRRRSSILQACLYRVRQAHTPRWCLSLRSVKASITLRTW